MPEYIEKFIDKGVRLLLDGKGYEFIEAYYEHVDKIYNYQIPALQIASKSKVKMTLSDYVNTYCKQKNKAGINKARQAHMELILKNNLNVDLGDVIYYINTGISKSHSDIKAIKSKESKKVDIEFNCQIIPQEQIEQNPNLINTDYNVPKYLDAFNKRIHPLLVCFSPEIRDNIIIDIVKDKKTKLIKLQDRNVFTEKQCKLSAGNPFSPEDQDTYEALMTMEDKEIRYWDSVNKIPNNMEEDKWEKIRTDYHERMVIARLESIEEEKTLINTICERLEVKDYDYIRNNNELTPELNLFLDINEETNYLSSKKWEVDLLPINIVFKYESLAIERDEFYKTIDNKHKPDKKYKMWLEHKEKSELNKIISLEFKSQENVSEPIINEIIEKVEEDDWNF